MRTVAITGASGGVGSRVVQGLVARARFDRIVPLARDIDRLAGSHDARVTPRRADYADPSSLTEALAGADCLVFISSDGDTGDMSRHHANVLSAARQCRVSHVVYLSILDIEATSRFYYAGVHRETEEEVKAGDWSHAIARTSVYSDFFMRFVDEGLQSGALRLPAGDGRVSFVTRRDVALALAAIADAGAVGTHHLTGPEALALHDVARIVRAATDGDLVYEPIAAAAYRAELVERRSAAWLIAAFTTFFESIAEGRFSFVSGDIEALTASKPRGFREFVAAPMD